MILSDKNYYYKLVQQPKPINIIFKTGESIDRIRRNRAKELEKLFKKIFDCSSKHNVTIQEIIYAFSKSKITVKKLSYIIDILSIKWMIRKTDFFYHREFRYFNDYILEEIGMKLTSESNLLTSRYEALYLFKSESDSMRYLEQLPKSITSVPIYLLKIELINKEYLEQFDNNWLNQFDHSFTAKDYENQAKDFLSRKKSKTPLYEVLFKGEYKVVECKLIL